MPLVKPESETCPFCGSSGNLHVHCYYNRHLIDFNGKNTVITINGNVNNQEYINYFSRILKKDGDKIKIDINKRTIDLLVDEETLAKRRENFKPYQNEVPKGYLSKYQRSVSQANFGAIAQ